MDKVINAVLENKIVVIVRGAEAEKLIPIAEAVYEGGIRLLEITFDNTGRTTDEETAENIKMLKGHFGDRMHIGAGTVTKTSQVELTKNAGGEFIISPDTDCEVIAKTKELGMVSMPGALTPSEIKQAHKSGADFVKLFPVSTLGADYVKAVRAPMPHIRMLAVGGIDENNMAEYLKSGVCGFGLGSNIIKKSLVDSCDWDGLKALAEKYVSIVGGAE